VLVTPYPEEDLSAAFEVVGSDALVMGSDWPHPEGFAHPAEFVSLVEGLPGEDRRRILYDQGARLVRG
jgi:predicted TIM-barrel fold metal-dependent hydrolase